MPKRVKIERETITRLFDQGETAKSASKALGIHYNTALQVFRNRNGMCARCGQKPVREGITKCAECAVYERKRMAGKRAHAVATKKCSMCTKPLMRSSKLYCEEHYYQTYDRQIGHRLLNKYGPHAMGVWTRAEGRCTLCHRPRGEQPLHLHHIDCDHANNREDNFIVLCFNCHRATHLLLASRNRVGLVEWFAKTYPDKPLL